MATTTSPGEPKGAFSAQLYNNLRPLNELLSNLQQVGIEKYIELPRIVVVGEQSAGIIDD